MKSASAELTALLNSSQQFAMADLLTITLKSGTVARYTSADVALTHNGNTFYPFPFKRGRTRITVGIEVDSLDLTLYAGIDDLIDGAPFPAYAQNGGFDGGTVRLDRAYLPDWGQPIAGTLWMFSGRIAEVTPSRTETRMSVKSDVEILTTPIPRNLYKPTCDYTLYDLGCGVAKAAYKASSTVAGGSTRTQIVCGLTQAPDWFSRGTITFGSGPNAGVTRTVKLHSAGLIELALALPNTPGVGDAFDVWPGCDKTLAMCETKFNNLAKYRGFPYVPVPETAY